LPTLQNKLLVRVEHSRVSRSISKLSLEGIYKTYIAIVCRTIKVPTASAIECMLCMLRLLARVLVSSKPIIVESKALIETLH
jgi:hypothetical protein